MDSKEQSDALWIVIRDAVQLLNVAYLWKVPVDEQWRMSYQELTERINKLSGRPETPEGRPAPAAIPEGLLREALQRLYDYEMGDQDHATDDELLAAMEQAAAALRASPSAPSEGVREAYDELIYSVETKCEGETRHDTALRYIREAENRKVSGVAKSTEPPNAGTP